MWGFGGSKKPETENVQESAKSDFLDLANINAIVKAEEVDDLQEVYNIFKNALDEPTTSADSRETISKRINLVDTIESRNQLEQFPSEISMITAFDELVQCYSVGGLIRNYYRFGNISYCDSQMEKFKFSMKINLKQKDEREAKVQEFFKKRLMENKFRGSSEDIWEARQTPLDNPFKEFD